MFYIITAYDIEWDIDKEDYICVGADGEDYYDIPQLSLFKQYRVEKDYSSVDNFMDMFGVEWDKDYICNLITEDTGFCVKSFSYKIELDETQEPEMTDELYEEQRQNGFVDYFNAILISDDEEEVEEGIPPELPEMPYPPPLLPKGKWEECCDTEEREDEITMEFVKYYKLPSMESMKHFVDNYKGDNEMVPVIKKWLNSDRDYMIYEGFIDIMKNPMEKEKCKEVGNSLYDGCNHIGANHMEAMRSVHYLVRWYFNQSNNSCIKAYPRLLEFYWSGIGEWRA